MSVSTYCGSATWLVLRILKKLGMLPHLAFNVSARVQGKRIRVPIHRGHGMNGLVIGEPWGHHIFAPLLMAFPGTFVDVGVNLGQTLIRIRSLSPETPYVGFEPNPICVQYTRELARINGFRDVPIVPAGLSDSDAILDLRMNNDDLTDQGASLVADFRPGVQVHHRFPVNVVRFETAERSLGIGTLGVVKIDVEGGEREVLRGLEARITSDRPAIVIEVLPVGRAEHVDRLERQQDIEAFFQRMDYRMNRIRNKGTDTSLEALTAPIGVHDDQDLSNFIVLPAERNEALFPELERALAQQ